MKPYKLIKKRNRPTIVSATGIEVAQFNSEYKHSAENLVETLNKGPICIITTQKTDDPSSTPITHPIPYLDMHDMSAAAQIQCIEFYSMLLFLAENQYIINLKL